MVIDEIVRYSIIYPKLIRGKIINFLSCQLGCYYALLTAKIHQNGINAFWWSGVRNFGDLITPLILKRYGFTPILVPPTEAKIAATGSILAMLGNEYSGLIVGSGLLSRSEKIRFPFAKVLALRGALTRELIGADPSTPLGDPGLLISDFLRKRPHKRYELGIVPHYEDYSDIKIWKILKNNNSKSIKIVNVMRSPKNVMFEIACCENVVSSSLHGCVIADSLGVPNCWVKISDKVIGKGFKFRDYYSALEVERDPILIDGNEDIGSLICNVNVPPKNIKQIQKDLRVIFKGLKERL